MKQVADDWRLMRSTMYSMDWYFIAIILLYTTLTLVFWSAIPQRWMVLAQNIVFLAVSLGIIVFVSKSRSHGLHTLRRFYVIPFVYPMYLQTFQLVPYVRTSLYDSSLASLDRMLFGVDPTAWIGRFAHPLLTEYLQWCYVAFFFLPCIHAIELYRGKRYGEFEEFSRLMVFSFFVSYVAYFAFPAVGPRFTLHDFLNIDVELPGVWFASVLREQVNIGGGILPGSLDPASVVNRDCMPSGHTMMTLVNILLSWRFRSAGRWFYTVVGCSLILATIYLRYHYAVDAIAGIMFAVAMFPLEPRVDRLLKQWRLVLPDHIVRNRASS
ncbi:MAG: phosphatase PAP2 family protein [Candidatus Kapaibacterium sp.]